MALAQGSRLGPYEVNALLGAGGMGEVYRATDSNLGRQVAVKVLPPAFVADPERTARFEREARTLAALNHPNIAHVYGLERSASQIALVMELVDGPTLADRLLDGPIPLEETLSIARQIAEALETAHEHGIVHRDLKPANIKIRADGAVKVLDFGLAKAMDPAAVGAISASDVTNSPTIASAAMTQAGIILGTAAYMSPEQARGKPVDKRTDIWAFGCVLYEMLTGKRAFAGDNVTDVLARVLERDIDFAPLPPTTPPAISRLLRRCLEKDRRQRLTDIGVARLDIDDARVPVVEEKAAARPQTSGRERMFWAAAVLVAASLGGAIGYISRPAIEPPRDVRFEIPVTPMRFQSDMAISPDGRRLAYSAATPDGRRGIWVRQLDAVEATLIPGTETADRQSMNPAWSPDARSLVFAGDGRLRRVDLGGGAPQVLTVLDGQCGGATWNKDNVIVFASNDHGLRKINATGGEVVAVSERDTGLAELYHDSPVFLPDGRRFLYLAWSTDKPASNAIYVGSLDSPSRTRLMTAESNAMYSQGHLLFMRGANLVAQPFDPDTLQFRGEPTPVTQNVAKDGGEVAAFAVSGNGTLIYRDATVQSPNRRLMWIDRTGRSIAAAEGTFETPGFRLSPDGRQIVFVEGVPGDIWTYDLTRNLRTRLTTDPAGDHNPIWSPDGTKILFDSHRGSDGGFDATIYEKPANGAAPERVLLPQEKGWEAAPRDFSADGRTLVFVKQGPPNNRWNLWGLSAGGESKPFAYRTGTFLEAEASLSPNGQWLAFTSNESGRDEVIVQAFPDASRGRWQISASGGYAPRWRRDGRELFYLDPRAQLIAVSTVTDGRFEIQQSSPIAQTPLPLPLLQAGANFGYDVTADGQRFLVAAPAGSATPAPILVRLNWRAVSPQ